MKNQEQSRSFKVDSPILWAVVFALLDVIWLVGATSLSTGEVKVALTTAWNVFHAPIRHILEPLLLPVVTSHPSYPSDGVWMLYFSVCVVQFLLLGFICGYAVQVTRKLLR